LELNHINFATGSANLTPESTTELSLIIDALNKYPTLNVEVSGHTDNVGEAAKNKTLSEARAKAVEDFVEKHGIDTKRISSVGFGDSKPIADSGTDAGRQLNRRTEFKILSK
jgi:outer membrane protein OmpA-like peptidoglycan-associated protein